MNPIQNSVRAHYKRNEMKRCHQKIHRIKDKCKRNDTETIKLLLKENRKNKIKWLHQLQNRNETIRELLMVYMCTLLIHSQFLFILFLCMAIFLQFISMNAERSIIE